MSDDDQGPGDASISRIGLVVSLLFGLGVFALGVGLSFGVMWSIALGIAASALVAYVAWPRLLKVRS